MIIFNTTRLKGIRASLSVKVCLCVVALSADLIATSGRKLAGRLAAGAVAGSGSESGGLKVMSMSIDIFGMGLEKAGLICMGLLAMGGLVGGSAFAAICYVRVEFPNFPMLSPVLRGDGRD